MMIADMNTLLLSGIVGGGMGNHNSLWGGLLWCAIGFGFLYSGLTQRPLKVNPFNPCNKPISVRTARIVYLPIAGLCFFFGVRDIVRALW